MNTIVTWMYASPKGERIKHAQMRGGVDDQKMQDHYWRCLLLLFESSFRLNTEVRHLLFVNNPPPEFVDSIPVFELLKQYNVELIEFPSITKSPSDYYNGWNSQFIVLDVLDWLSENLSEDDIAFILDTDIIFNRPISEEMMNAISSNRALLYSIDYESNHVINGLTKQDLLSISKDMNRPFPSEDFVYSGGEFICALGDAIKLIAETGRSAYEESLTRHKSGKPKFSEEAHLLSYVYSVLGYRTHTGNRFIKRIWTDRSVGSNIDGSEAQLILWHLPAEKRSGFKTLFRSIRKSENGYRLTRKDFDIVFHLRENFYSWSIRIAKQIIRPIYDQYKRLKPE